MIKLICILSLIFTSASLAAVEVRFDRNPVVESDVIMLSDIATISGDPQLCEKLSTIEIGRSAKPGKIRIMQTGTLKQFYINSIVPVNEIDFYNEGKIEVQTNAQYLSRAEIEDSVRVFIKNHYQENKMYELQFKATPKSVPVPLKNWSLAIEKGLNFDTRGRELLYVVITHDRKVIKRIKIQVMIKVFEDVVFTTHYIKRNNVLSESDLEVRNVETTNIHRPLVREKKDIVGKALRRSLNKERMVFFNYVDEPFLVKRGVKIRLKTKIGDGFIYATAIARENGRAGDVVRVQNDKSKKMIRGTVGADGSVWVIN